MQVSYKLGKKSMKKIEIGQEKKDTFLSFQHHCTPDESKMVRLDMFLAENIEDHSRSSVRRFIQQGCVSINDKTVSKAGYLLKDNDCIEISLPAPLLPELQSCDVPFTIIDEQEDFLVINKPAGLMVHHAPSAPQEPTLVNGLLYRFQNFKTFNDTHRPGIVHRLDKNTSGLLLVARNQRAHRELSELFKDRKIQKTYLAIVSGHPDRQGTVIYPVGRHPHQRHKMACNGIASRHACTHFQVLSYYNDTTLLALKPVTGRTHQIRVHCAALGHGIIGDATYGEPSKLISRQALHAWKLLFEHKGKRYEYRASVPDDFKHALQQLHSAK